MAVIKVNLLKCKRCEYKWMPRKVDIRQCPKCRSTYWNDKKTSKTAKKGEQMSEKVKFNPRTEVEDFLSDKHVIFHDDKIYIYVDGYYKPILDRALTDDISLHIDNTYGGRLAYAKEILELIKCRLSKIKVNFNKNCSLVNCKNGILNMKTMELLPHSPNIIFINQMRFHWLHLLLFFGPLPVHLQVHQYLPVRVLQLR